jgi:hypothetical protein
MLQVSGSVSWCFSHARELCVFWSIGRIDPAEPAENEIEMRLAVRVKVEAVTFAKQQGPHDGKNCRRSQDLRKFCDSRLPKLARSHASLYQGTHRG